MAGKVRARRPDQTVTGPRDLGTFVFGEEEYPFQTYEYQEQC